MSTFSRILVAVDDSSASDSAVQLGARLAIEHEGTLTLCHAVDWIPLVSRLASTGSLVDVDSIVAEMNAAGDAQLARRRQTARRAGISADCRLLEGAPSAAIIDHAERERQTLIVMGTRGSTAMERIFTGSTTESILRKSTTPVLTVRAEAQMPAGTRRIFERVIVGVDDSAPSASAIATVLDFPAEDRRELLFYAVAGYETGAYEKAEYCIGKALAAADRHAVAAKGLVLTGHAGNMLVAAAQQRGADLIVVGTHGRHGLQRMFLGSVAEHIVRHASTPILVVAAPRSAPAGLASKKTALLTRGA